MNSFARILFKKTQDSVDDTVQIIILHLCMDVQGKIITLHKPDPSQDKINSPL
ncbi:MAG: hypothetical protein IPF93_16795 [Saprospiraceae bacterium]|nr:hypothetical protein [Saprospiraceae bacterium]